VRAVLDANVLVSALLSRVGAAARLVESWLAGESDLVVSRTLLGEVDRALAYPRVRRRVPDNDAEEFIRVLEELAEVVDGPEAAPPVQSRDPGDNYLLALAAREQVPLVSGDAHLLALRNTHPILSPREFLEELERRP
jgi:putative PIN family toxin of toxin-antitoxin system